MSNIIDSLEFSTLINGNINIVDAADENAPMLKLEFCNEFIKLPDEIKAKIAIAAMNEILTYYGNKNK